MNTQDLFQISYTSNFQSFMYFQFGIFFLFLEFSPILGQRLIFFDSGFILICLMLNLIFNS